jgi:hypothetical protein
MAASYCGGLEMLTQSRYANQAASDAHMAIQPVQDLIALFTTGDVLAQPLEFQNCPVATKRTSGSPLSVSSNPAIIIINIDSGAGTMAQGIERWKSVANTAMSSVEGLSVFNVAEDKEADSVRVECVLKDWDVFAELQKTVLNGKQSAMEIIKFRPIDGFVDREDRG